MKYPLWIKFRVIRRDHFFFYVQKKNMGKRKAFRPTKFFFLLDALAHWNAKDAKRLAAFPGVRIQRLAGHFVRAFDLTHPMRNRRSNKTFPEQEFHTVMCGVVFEIPGKWRRENGLRLLRDALSLVRCARRSFAYFGQAKKWTVIMLAWQVSHFQNCADA